MEIDSIITNLKKLYDIRVSPQDIKKAEGGFLSTNYIIENYEKLPHKKYFLKKYRFNKKDKIEEIHSIKKYFSEKDIPVILPIPNKEGKTYFEWRAEEGKSFYALFPFVEGIHFSRDNFSNMVIASLAETLGKIHLAGKDYKGPASQAFKLKSPEDLQTEIQKYLDIIKSKTNKDPFDLLAEKTLSLKLELLSGLGYSFEDTGLTSDHLIHGDYHNKNVFFDSKGKVTAVFDFEKSGMGPRVFELWRSIDYSDRTKAEQYIRSYGKIYPITEDELARGLRLYYLKLISSLWIEKAHYVDGNFRTDSFLETQYSSLKYFGQIVK
ncbi:MAG: phosphotransferase [bacterium]